jgi:hypothetical protein
LATRLADSLDEFRSRFLTEQNHILWKTWGDGILIASDDPVDLADIALDLRDYFRNANWERKGFPVALSMRVGCHLERTEIAYEDGKVVDVHGKSVNSAARIEPVVDPGSIFCSQAFKDHVESEESGHYHWIELGLRALAKEFGERNLFELLRVSEVGSKQPAQQLEIPRKEINIPRIRREFSDLEKDEFLEHAFNAVKSYFAKAGEALSESDTRVSFKLDDFGDRIQSKIYVDRTKSAVCNIWRNEEHRHSEIRYSGNENFSNSFNLSYSVDDDGYEMSMRTYFDFSSEDKNLSIEHVCERLWNDFVRQLTY